MTESERWMRRALRLATKGFTAPNPMVGCVLVRNGEIVGEGYHFVAGMPHAEVNALQQAGERARGATAYVTLEPCCHYGRTPPCTKALIAAGVRHVVVATLDPDPRVRGRGVAELREAGLSVEVGVLEPAARALNRAFFHFHETGLPLITLKVAMTLDGKVATFTGDTRWITGQKARNYVHRLRSQSGAVLAGIGTVLADDPRLDARLPGRPSPRQPLRVIVDSHLRTPPCCAAIRLAQQNPQTYPLLIATTAPQPPKELAGSGVEVVTLPSDSAGRVDLHALTRLLATRQIISVLVEGGPTLHEAFLKAGLANRVLFFIAPKLVGGKSAPTAIEGDGVATLAEAWQLSPFTVRRLAPDIVLEADVLPAQSRQVRGEE
ncbi:diaminohydroxyphosphoribosylaminopyrimidine deaminase [Chthonomonas calidirosea]|uniref:Riboflavin biosynthesis protein RibD n=1 Tax=Chthonomonas calidirosea (strain DSM 23976 / ICMP 18418 / T49) TaxID=1303518 RepID=S0ET59_CHTCT|nr:bifunctional diaminohydroxyphosphoribosylaminopyrimidine deaminase/5-amino-6-(5-phosphoribosylamino)uracil reductase RibD [Chthonomonas calidirosea]CCW34621.1 riboflavin biosynthesis protein RibD [Chthonomonas calidirosea T49]CEK14260.1 diaminohydroxyphosphoribosylaminopyrimidine deaminase [Chthonomonas calidirosea]